MMLNKICYVNDAGVTVHVYLLGAWVCQCGEKKGAPLQEPYCKKRKKKYIKNKRAWRNR